MKITGRNKREIAYGALALIGFVILLAVTYRDRDSQGSDALPKQQVQVVVFGDSVMGQTRDETSIPHQLAGLLDKTVFNAALGGTCMGRSDEEQRMGFTKDCLSMVGLAEAIAARDFGVQQTARIRENATEYFNDTIDEMENIDYDSVELFLIACGVNDYHHPIPIYAEDNPYDEYTFTGALRNVIKELQQACPDARIVLITPTYTWYTTRNLTCEEYNTGGGLLEEYVEAELAVAKELGIEIIDLYHDVYPHETWEDWQLYTLDGLHPNEAGRTLLAETIASYLK